jgi:hypothetical protein
MLNGPRATWGKKDHCGVVHYLPAIFKALRLFKVLPSLFLGVKKSPKEGPISLKQDTIFCHKFFFWEVFCQKCNFLGEIFCSKDFK